MRVDKDLGLPSWEEASRASRRSRHSRLARHCGPKDWPEPSRLQPKEWLEPKLEPKKWLEPKLESKFELQLEPQGSLGTARSAPGKVLESKLGAPVGLFAQGPLLEPKPLLEPETTKPQEEAVLQHEQKRERKRWPESTKPQEEGAPQQEQKRERKRWGCCYGFPFCCIHCPVLAALVAVGLAAALVVLRWPGMEVDTDFDSFLDADSPANDVRAAFLEALPFRKPSRRLQRALLDPNLLHKIMEVRLIYRSKSEAGLMSYEALTFIRDLESKLRSLPRWRSLCDEYTTNVLQLCCDPGFSIVNLVWPEQQSDSTQDPQQGSKVGYSFNGRGLEPLPLGAALALVEARSLTEVILPKDYEEGAPVQFLQSKFEFNLACCMADDSSSFRTAKIAELDKVYKEFIKEDLYPALVEFGRGSSVVDVFWDGDVLSSYEFQAAILSDSLFAVYSAAFIMAYLTFHTRSLFVSIGALILTFSAVPVAFVVSAVASGSNRVTAVSFLSLFLIVGIGADDILVFIAFWELAKAEGGSRVQRVRFLYRHAGSACLATTVTTAASFFANLASVLRPLREFGFFMGLCILGTFCFLLVGLPALLVVQELFAHCRCCRCCRPRLPKPPKALAKLLQKSPQLSRLPSFQQCLAAYIENVTVPFRRSCVVFFMLMPVVFAVWTVCVSELDGGLPEMFPQGHNLREKPTIEKAVSDGTIPWWQDVGGLICTIGTEVEAACPLNWCSIEGEAPPLQLLGDAENGTCDCQAVSLTNCQDTPGYFTLSTRFVGVASIPTNFWVSKAWREHAVEALALANGDEPLSGSVSSVAVWQKLAPLVQEHWETGIVQVVPFILAPLMRMSMKSSGSRLCNVQQVCYCGAPSCQLGALRSPKLELQLPRPSPEPRRLTVKTIDISLVWGLRIVHGSPLLGVRPEGSWAFSSAFKPEIPSVQRHLLAACRGADEEAMLIEVRDCWLETFRKWMSNRGEVFPARSTQFKDAVTRFAASGTTAQGRPVSNHMWFDEDGDLRATFVVFDVRLTYAGTPAAIALRQMEKWDAYANKLNSEAPIDAGTVWHTSQLWLRAEAEQAIVSSTLGTMVMSVGCGFLGALFFTHGDLWLAVLVSTSVVCVTISLAWFMSAPLGWKMGAVEVLGLIVFGGYSLTYSLHIAHKYREEVVTSVGQPARARRRGAVVHALKSMTSAVVGSAATTLGSTLFLFCCTIRVFVKLATVMFVVTFFAALFALTALPAVLLCVGPLGHFSCDGIVARVSQFSAKLLAEPETAPKPACEAAAEEQVGTGEVSEAAQVAEAAPQAADAAETTAEPPAEQRQSEESSLQAPGDGRAVQQGVHGGHGQLQPPPGSCIVVM